MKISFLAVVIAAASGYSLVKLQSRNIILSGSAADALIALIALITES
jgi:hypothetical protein